MSGSGCQVSWPPDSIAAETASGSPIAPSSSSDRARWYAPLEEDVGCAPEPQAVLAPRDGQLPRLRHGRPERLLGVHVLARLERRPRHGGVRRRRGEVEDDVDRVRSGGARRRGRARGRSPRRATSLRDGSRSAHATMSKASKADSLSAYVPADHAAADDPDLGRRSHAGLATIVVTAANERRAASSVDRLRSRPARPGATRRRGRGSPGGRAGSPTAPSPTGTNAGRVPAARSLTCTSGARGADPRRRGRRARRRRTRPSRGRARGRAGRRRAAAAGRAACDRPSSGRSSPSWLWKPRRSPAAFARSAAAPIRSTTRVGLGDRGRRRDPARARAGRSRARRARRPARRDPSRSPRAPHDGS